MRKFLKTAAALCFLGFLGGLAVLHWFGNNTLAVTFGTALYHFAMRFLVGFAFDALMGNRADITKRWYQPQPWETQLYARLRVKEWKDKLPSYDPELFSPRTHTWQDIAQAMCQAELVHETIIVLSFLPLVASHWFGALPVFLITSLCAAAFDLPFVIMQRYNRPRVVRLAGKRR